MRPMQKRSELFEAMLSLTPFFKRVLFFSFFTSLLALASTFYMLEVYDRVVNSRNEMTLLMLTLLVLGAYVLLEVLEWARTGVMHEAGLQLDARLGERVFDAVFAANLRRIPGGTSQALSDLRNLRDFLSTPAVMAVMDAPLALLILILVFIISPVLGWFAVFGAVLQVTLSVLAERNTGPQLMAANRSAIEAQTYASGALRNAQVIEAMGMQGNIFKRWMGRQRKFLLMQAMASDNAGVSAAISKFVQNMQSSMLLGLSCWLALKGMMLGGGGMMIVASTLGGKAIAPLVQLIAQWRQIVNARDAYNRLEQLLEHLPASERGMPLPAPKGALAVEGVVAGAPGNPAAILRGVNFGLPAGEALAVIGPSASGKTTLARLLVGIWPAANGKVRLDGADVHAWHKTELGPHIGYLPQSIELFDGTLAENIARFGEVDRSKVETAARAVGLHEMIMALPDGYDSRIGEEGCFLSGGQRQRVGLARAIYGNPRFIVLDEPNSSLDEAGEAALLHTMRLLKAQGATQVVITHRTSVLPVVDRMLVLRDGQVQAYGPRDEVLAALSRAAQPAPAAPAPAGAPLPAAQPA